MDYKKLIRDIPDYPVKGVIFKDLTTLWKNRESFHKSIDELIDMIKHIDFEKVLSMEARGFIIGSVISYKLKKGFVPVRKKGKLPYKTVSYEYELEYGKDQIFIHEDAIEKNEKILIVDDLLATGGTTNAAIELVKKLNGIPVGAAYLVELSFLEGRKKVNIPIYSLIKY
ncbi:MAG TPA: adenine phosphoribosyltransferase [Spirochaetota bacterium]|nr:adenine phosphoribosyltransferase [Spirochaetota bacterium]HOM39002.1 adenine phosphoribosyltransferase [Spirochaetota bacterium]HPQ49952.1 adenine phosphoribosyltransferase [Spirochaetota bacterium]